MSDRLTPRELEVLELATEGLDEPETARRLGLGRGTVHGHRSSIRSKLGAENMAHAVALAIQRGIIK